MPSASNVIADRYRAHAISLLRFDAGLRKTVLGILRDLEAQLVRQLQVDGIGDERLTAFGRQRAENLLAQVRTTIINASYEQLSQAVMAQLQPLAVVENKFLANAFEQALATNLLTDALTGDTLSTIAGETLVRGAPSTEWWQRQAVALSQRFADQMRQGIAAGETNADLVRRVRGSRANGFKDGIMQASRRDADALVRSSVQAVANETRTRFYRENSDVVKGYIYHATLDSRTTQQCISLDGYTWDIDGNPLPGQGKSINFQQPPIHWSCRSTLLPLLKSFKELGLGDINLPAATRSSMDGQLPADISFTDWLKGKPATFQDDLLGIGKGSLFREGKASLLDMIDQSGRPLSLEQLEASL